MNRIRAYVTLAVPVAGVERLLIETRASDPWVQLSVDAAEWVVGGYAQQWIGNRLEILDPGCWPRHRYVRVSCCSADPVTFDLCFPARSDVATYRLLPHRLCEAVPQASHKQECLSRWKDSLAADVLRPDYPEEEIDKELREAGYDPDEIGRKGAALALYLLSCRKPSRK